MTGVEQNTEPTKPRGLLDIFTVSRDRTYYQELKKIVPDLSPMSYNDVKMYKWKYYSPVYTPEKSPSSEYRESYRDFLKDRGYQKARQFIQCSHGNPITCVDQNMKILPKIPQGK
ncbi:unnamed protein product [Calicophoron daubneyi]|uniref:Uncharacterized protein n=1 Tax=Calicophoron daubneyi TaxID=300641 RepID=A0AAV2TBN9_CALDB